MATEREGQGSPRRLETVGIWAEIIAAAAVVVSLIFVGVQVGQTAEETALNTEATRAAAYTQSVDQLNQWRLALAEDSDLARLWEGYLEGDFQPAQAGDEIRLHMLLVTLWATYENNYYANEYGLLGPAEWERHRSQICTRYHADADRWNRRSAVEGPQPIRALVSREFATYVEDDC